MSSLWLPGQGMVSLEGTAIARAVSEYDENLFYARNATTGLHTIFSKSPHGEDPVPVLAFPDGEPSLEYLQRRLYETDIKRHGERIRAEIRRHNDAIKERYEYESQQAAGEYAEVLESILHDQDQTPYKRVHLGTDPVKKTAVKRG